VTKSLKRQIVEALVAQGDALKATGVVKKFAREATPFHLEDITPALSLTIGPEDVVDEDNQGYVIEFPCFWKLTLGKTTKDAGTNPYDGADLIEQQVQARIEQDTQLAGLIVWLKYEGNLPFTNEVNSDKGGTLLTYTYRYRRARNDPAGRY
jgi:hypothetical protein